MSDLILHEHFFLGLPGHSQGQSQRCCYVPQIRRPGMDIVVLSKSDPRRGRINLCVAVLATWAMPPKGVRAPAPFAATFTLRLHLCARGYLTLELPSLSHPSKSPHPQNLWTKAGTEMPVRHCRRWLVSGTDASPKSCNSIERIRRPNPHGVRIDKM